MYNKANKMELEKQEINEIRRYRPMDSIDYYEILRSDIKIECWNEFINEMMSLIICNFPQGKVSNKDKKKHRKSNCQLYKMNVLYN